MEHEYNRIESTYFGEVAERKAASLIGRIEEANRAFADIYLSEELTASERYRTIESERDERGTDWAMRETASYWLGNMDIAELETRKAVERYSKAVDELGAALARVAAIAENGRSESGRSAALLFLIAEIYPLNERLNYVTNNFDERIKGI